MALLGSLFVELTANTAQFLGAMDKASYAAKKTGKDIESSFSKLGGIATQALAPFGALGEKIGAAMQTMGATAGKAFSSFTQFGTAGKLAASSAAAFVAGTVLAEAGIIGLTVHTAEHIAKMGELAEATGVSVESLSKLSFVAKTVGVDTEALAKGLQKMDKSAFAAATASGSATNAYKRLHVEVKETTGQMRSADAIFADLAGKFSNMADGPAKTALAIQLFGREGAKLIPVLNLGKDAVEDLIKTLEVLHGVITDKDVAGAKEFKTTLTVLGGVFEGLALQVERKILPALQSFLDFIISDLKSGTGSTVQTLINSFAWLTKAIIYVGETGITLLGMLGDAFKAFGAIVYKVGGDVGAVLADIFITGDWEKAKADAAKAVKDLGDNWDTFTSDMLHRAALLTSAYDAIFNPKEPKTKPDKGKKGGDTATDDKAATAAMQLRIDALKAQIALFQKLGSAGSAAEVLIAKAIAAGTEEFKKMEATAAKNPAAAALVASNKGLIEAAAQAKVFGALIIEDIDALDKQKQKLLEEGDAAKQMAAAFKQGGPAIAQAALNAEFADQQALLNVLISTHTILLTLWGAENPIVKGLANSVANLNTILNAAKDAAKTKAAENFNKALQDQQATFKALAPFVEGVNAAFLQNEAAVRAANVELQVQTVIQDALRKGIVLSNDAIEEQRAYFTAAAKQAQESADAQAASQYTLSAIYDQQVAKLERIREVMQQNGKSTLLIDAAIYTANEDLIHQWDTAVMKVGSLGDAFKGMANEIILMGEHLQEKVFGAIIRAVDDLSSKLAEFVVKGKADFKALFESLEQDILKASFQKLIGTIVAKIPGLEKLLGKPDGTSEDKALWVRVSTKGTTTPGQPGGSGGIGGILGSIFGTVMGKPDGTQKNPFYVVSANGAGNLPLNNQKWPTLALPGVQNPNGDGGDGGDSGDTTSGISGKMQEMMSKIMTKMMDVMKKIMDEITKIITKIIEVISKVIEKVVSVIGSLFGGGKAAGGDVTPGKAYLVGEHRPELFIPRVQGTIIPSVNLGTGKQLVYAPVFNIATPDADSFHRSQSQIMADGFTALRINAARMGR